MCPSQRSVRSGDPCETGSETVVLEPCLQLSIELLRIDLAPEKKQVARVQATRAKRDSAKVESTLAALKKGGAKEDVNLMALIIDASREFVTIGEMCDALRAVWGVWERRRSSNSPGSG
jgi:methylmalonyl-CoA mutase, N-terminal domain